MLDPAIGTAFVAAKEPEAGRKRCAALERISSDAVGALPCLAERLENVGADGTPWNIAALRAVAKFGSAGKPASRGIRLLWRDEDGKVREPAEEALAAVEANPK